MKTFFKWLGIVLGSIVVIILLIFLYAGHKANSALEKTYDIGALKAIYVPEDSATVERGRHLATAIAMCVGCHGMDMGGEVLVNDPGGIGIFSSSNVTTGKGGKGKDYQDIKAFDKVVRHGIRHDGTGVWMMPSQNYWRLSNEDVAAIFAWYKTIPPVDREIPPLSFGPIGKMLFMGGILPPFAPEMINHTAVRPTPPPPGPTMEYGKHLATMVCTDCHHENLAGGPIPGAPPEWPIASNITKGGALANYTEQDFVNALREGIRPGGAKIDTVMPYRLTKGMTDEEIHAIWAFMQTVPAAPLNTK